MEFSGKIKQKIVKSKPQSQPLRSESISSEQNLQALLQKQNLNMSCFSIKKSGNSQRKNLDPWGNPYKEDNIPKKKRPARKTSAKSKLSKAQLARQQTKTLLQAQNSSSSTVGMLSHHEKVN